MSAILLLLALGSSLFTKTTCCCLFIWEHLGQAWSSCILEPGLNHCGTVLATNRSKAENPQVPCSLIICGVLFELIFFMLSFPIYVLSVKGGCVFWVWLSRICRFHFLRIKLDEYGNTYTQYHQKAYLFWKEDKDSLKIAIMLNYLYKYYFKYFSNATL